MGLFEGFLQLMESIKNKKYNIFTVWANNNMYSSSIITTPAGQFFLSQNLLGQGSFGSVYKGHFLTNNKPVAIKIATLDHVQMAIQQSNILKKLNFYQDDEHLWNLQSNREGVLNFYGTFRSYNLFYIVQQFYGKPLSKIMEFFQPFHLIQSLSVFQAILKSLRPLRDGKILHRDIKPENILLQYNQIKEKYEAKMCDFGLSMIEKCGKNSSIQMERAGTIAYESPEVIKFKEYSQKSQVWSLGIILYFLIYKKLPYEKRIYLKAETLYEAMMTDNIKFHGIPKPIQKIIEKCLSTNTNKRIDFNSLQKQVDSVIGKLPEILQQYKKKTEELEKQKNKVIRIEQDLKSTSVQHVSTSNSNVSTCSKDKLKKKQSEEFSQLNGMMKDNCININFIKLLNRTYEQLKLRIIGAKQKKQIVLSLLNICEKFTKEELSQEYVNYFSPEVVKILRQNIERMKIICQYAQQQKQISFNLKQFMLVDTLMILYEVTKTKAQFNPTSNDHLSKSMEKLQVNLQFEGQAKSMHYYKQLRNKMNNFA